MLPMEADELESVPLECPPCQNLQCSRCSDSDSPDSRCAPKAWLTELGAHD